MDFIGTRGRMLIGFIKYITHLYLYDVTARLSQHYATL